MILFEKLMLIQSACEMCRLYVTVHDFWIWLIQTFVSTKICQIYPQHRCFRRTWLTAAWNLQRKIKELTEPVECTLGGLLGPSWSPGWGDVWGWGVLLLTFFCFVLLFSSFLSPTVPLPCFCRSYMHNQMETMRNNKSRFLFCQRKRLFIPFSDTLPFSLMIFHDHLPNHIHFSMQITHCWIRVWRCRKTIVIWGQ